MSILILVVDDEPDVEMLFRQQFRRETREGKFALQFALSAMEALERLAGADDKELILILSDINMPGMSGLELLPQIKQLHPQVPVVMITAYGDADTRSKALALGAQDLLTKPVDFIALKARISTQMTQKGFAA